METPITYFYTDRVRRVKVAVDFPKGLLTEFYPPVRSMMPPVNETALTTIGEKVGRGRLDWGQLTLVPQSKMVPDLADEKLQQELANRASIGATPRSNRNDHYAAARYTDSALVLFNQEMPSINNKLQILNQGMNVTPGLHAEKFLFYRGVGDFEMPLSAATWKKNESGNSSDLPGTYTIASDRIRVTNRSQHPIVGGIYFKVEGEKIRMTSLASIAPGHAITTARPVEQLDGVGELNRQMKSLLVGQGLFEKEADAMLATWDNAWFTEQGSRVLYIVPQAITDEMLPLHVSPKPKKTLRVLVGRLEMLSVAEEKRMTDLVTESVKQRAAFWAKKPGKGAVYPLPKSLTDYGRMAEPSLARVRLLAKDQSVKEEARLLIDALRNKE